MPRYMSRTPHEPNLEDGETYDATIVKVEDEDGIDTQWGKKDRYVFTFDVGGLELKQRYNKSMFPKSNYVRLIATLDPEHFDGIGYDADDLIGKQCRVLIKHTTNEETGDVWDNIDTVLKPKRHTTFRDICDTEECRE
ncbi:MAG: hypothetical protein ACXV2E_00770 [Halobacteriota archaeon]